MFIMENAGRKISAARKAKNMTQMELADRLNISFQAVSNWERGISMPDISKLPELSELLDISIDELLGKSSALVKGLIAEDADAYFQKNPVDPEELVEAAPILKPGQVDKAFERRRRDFDDSELEGLLPFLGQEACDALFDKYCAREDIERAVDFAPFVSQKKIGEVAIRCAKEGKDVSGLLPFAGRDGNDAIAWAVFEARGASELDDYLPFTNPETLFKIAMMEYEANGMDDVEAFLPFLKSKHVTELAKVAGEKGGLKAITPLAPFLDRDLFWNYLKEML